MRDEYKPVEKMKFQTAYFLKKTLLTAAKSPNVQHPNDFRPMQQRMGDYVQHFANKYQYLHRQADELVAEYNKLVHNYRALKQNETRLRNLVKKHEEVMERQGIRKQLNQKRLKEIEEATDYMVKEAQERQDNVDAMTQELQIKQEQLEENLADMDLALSKTYTFTEDEIEFFETKKELILKGVAETGTVWGALQKYPELKISHTVPLWYAQKHKDFQQDLEVAHAMFRDKFHGTVIDRALNGTDTPLSYKGEFTENVKVKDNKLLIEAAKVVMPEKYNRKSADAEPSHQTNNNVLIQNFSQVNEAALGYTHNVGVVTHVDDRGKVQRIQENKMVEFYKDKPGAQVIEQQQTEE